MDTLELKKHIADALAKYPNEVSRYHNGQTGLIGVFCGEVMLLSKGKADPKTLVQLITGELNASVVPMDTETTTPAHTPTPKVEGSMDKYIIRTDTGRVVAKAYGEIPDEQKEHMELIVTAVNSHESNVKRIQELEEALEQCVARINPKSKDTWDLKAIYVAKSALSTK